MTCVQYLFKLLRLLWISLARCVKYLKTLTLILRFDPQTKHVFVGDYSGLISVLRLENNQVALKTTLKGHSGDEIFLTSMLLIHTYYPY